LVQAQVKGTRVDTGSYDSIQSDIPANISGRTYAAIGQGGVLYTGSIAVGSDTTGAAVLQAVEARIPSGIGGIAWSTPVSLVTSAVLFGVNGSGTIIVQQMSQITGGTPGAAVGVDSRESGYFSAIENRRFSFTHQTPGTLITAQATFAATTPTLILYNSAGNGTTIILRTVRVTVLEATTAPVFISVAIDTADRFSAGGTVITGQNWNEASAVAYPGTAFRFNATASAAGAGTRYLWTDAIPTGIGASITISFRDGVIVSGVGSVLVYLWDSAGLNGADIVEDVEVEAY
jgi:hypothetical protein